MPEKEKHITITPKARVPIGWAITGTVGCLYLSAMWYDLRINLNSKASIEDVQQLHNDVQDFRDRLEDLNGQIKVPALRIHQTFRPAAPITSAETE
jgi:hypothetical protein